MTISSPRAEIVARARVTDRMRPLKIDRATIHQVGLPWHWGSGGPVTGRRGQRPDRALGRPQHVDPRVQGVRRSTSAPAATAAARRKLAGIRDTPPGVAPDKDHPAEVDRAMSELSIIKPGAQRMGFFTDTTICIGCKACEVACKQWNDLPADGGEFRKGGSYDNTGELGANDLAPRALRRARRQPRRLDRPERRRRLQQLDLHVRRLQALHARGLHGRLPDRAR